MVTETVGSPKRARGRPKTFDRTVALRQAMTLFWERGYEGTTFDDLIAAMGISASSFYNAFGSKEQLYQEASGAFMAQSSEWFLSELAAAMPTKTTFHRLLKAAACAFTQNDLPKGCMISLACTQVPPSLASVRDMMASYRSAGQAAMADRIRRGIAEGDLPKDTDPDVLAAFYSALSRGMAVLARDGASREQLLEIADLGMRAWPAAQESSRAKFDCSGRRPSAKGG
jgi:AcrR family transcriptional regulator